MPMARKQPTATRTSRLRSRRRIAGPSRTRSRSGAGGGSCSLRRSTRRTPAAAAGSAKVAVRPIVGATRPPRAGPAIVLRPCVAAARPITEPRRPEGAAEAIMAIPAVADRPAASPWTARAAQSSHRCSARANPMVASSSSVVAAMRTRRPPTRSESRPAGKAVARPTSGYAAYRNPTSVFESESRSASSGNSGRSER